MRGIVSFHPVDVEFYGSIVGPLLGGGKIDPAPFLAASLALRDRWAAARRHARALENALIVAEPPAPDPGASLFQRVKTQVIALDHKVDAITAKLQRAIDPDLHLHGRPFLITESSASAVAEWVEEFRRASSDSAAEGLALEQIVRLDPAIARAFPPEAAEPLSGDLQLRSELLGLLRDLHELGKAARTGETWVHEHGPKRPAMQVLQDELSWRATWLHSRARPFWIGRDVDGLVTICRAAGMPVPSCVTTAAPLFETAVGGFPSLAETFHLELEAARDVGAYVPPAGLDELIEFLTAEGAAIIRVATRHGEGPAATVLLRKIRECATYARQHGLGYLEASGILPPDLEDVEQLA